MHRPLLLAVALALALPGALAGCGGETREVRVAIELLAGDGEPPGPLWLVAADRPAGGPRYPLVRRGTALGSLPLFVAEAPAGSYVVVNDAGWQTLMTGQTLPWFHADPEGLPNVVAMARPYTLYLRARAADRWKAAPRVALERRRDDDPPRWERLDVPVLDQGGGWVSVTLPREVAVPRATFRIFAFMEGDVPARVAGLVLPENPAIPYVRLLETEVGAPLGVRVVGDAVPDGTAVEVRLPGHPLDPRWTTRFVAGRAWFNTLGEQVEGIEVRVPAWGDAAVWHLDHRHWEREGGLLLLAVPAATGRRVRLPWTGGEEPVRVLLVPGDGDELGTALWERAEDGLHVVVPSGALSGWIETDSGFAPVDIEAAATTGTVGEVAPAARITGSADVAAGGYVVVAERAEGDRWRRGAGLEVGVQPGGRYELRVPAGHYRLRLRRPDQRLGAPFELPVEVVPGRSLSGVDLDPR